MSRDAELDQLADELYALPVAEFTAARNARAKEARAGRDPQLADALQAVRKPTTAAWLANTLVRERPLQVGRLLELGEGLRRAQAALDADALRRLSQERHVLFGELSSSACELGTAGGARSLGTSTLRELEATLEAALLDPRAAEDLRRGRLTGALSYSGLGFLSPGAALEGTAGEPMAAKGAAAKGSAAKARAAKARAAKARWRKARGVAGCELED